MISFFGSFLANLEPELVLFKVDDVGDDGDDDLSHQTSNSSSSGFRWAREEPKRRKNHLNTIPRWRAHWSKSSCTHLVTVQVCSWQVKRQYFANCVTQLKLYTLYKLSSSIFYCLSVSQWGIGVTRPNLHFFQYIQAYKPFADPIQYIKA